MGHLRVSLISQRDDELSLLVTEGGFMPSDPEDSAVLPPSGVVAQSKSDAELATVLAWAAASIGLEYVPPPSPKCSWLDDWFLDEDLNRLEAWGRYP